jgi:hypothetical protein
MSCYLSRIKIKKGFVCKIKIAEIENKYRALVEKEMRNARFHNVYEVDAREFIAERARWAEVQAGKLICEKLTLIEKVLNESHAHKIIIIRNQIHYEN